MRTCTHAHPHSPDEMHDHLHVSDVAEELKGHTHHAQQHSIPPRPQRAGVQGAEWWGQAHTLLPRPAPSLAPAMMPAMSTKRTCLGTKAADLATAASLSRRASGTDTSAVLGSGRGGANASAKGSGTNNNVQYRQELRYGHHARARWRTRRVLACLQRSEGALSVPRPLTNRAKGKVGGLGQLRPCQRIEQ